MTSKELSLSLEKDGDSPEIVAGKLLRDFREQHEVSVQNLDVFLENWKFFEQEVITRGAETVGFAEARPAFQELHGILSTLATDSPDTDFADCEARLRTIQPALQKLGTTLHVFLDHLRQKVMSTLGDPIAAVALSFIAHDLPKIALYAKQISDSTLSELRSGKLKEIVADSRVGLDIIGTVGECESEKVLDVMLKNCDLSSAHLQKRYEALTQSSRAVGSPSHLSSYLNARFSTLMSSNELFRKHPVTLRVTSSLPMKEKSVPAVGITLEILAELVTNALKVMALTQVGKTITVDIGRSATHLVLRVTDDGPGISADMKAESLFSKGVETTTKKLGGSGNGLRLTRGGVEAFWNGASLQAEKNHEIREQFPASDVPESGLTFMLKIPLQA